MNLRKDHCRNLPSRTTREPVDITGGGRGDAPAAGAPPSRPTPRGEGLVPLLAGETTNPRRGLRQGNLTREHAPAAPETVRRGVRRLLSHVSKTTLGNGYLGSRIDEERSEMRYLV